MSWDKIVQGVLGVNLGMGWVENWGPVGKSCLLGQKRGILQKM